MNKNRLKKTASILLAGIMSFGVFAFAGPVFNVNADEEYNFNDIEAWPTVGKYRVATIGDVEWCALDCIEVEECFGNALPSIKEEIGKDVSHFYVYGSNYTDVTITKPLVLAETSVTLDLNGHNLNIQTSDQILELTAASSYTITNSSSDSSSICSSNGLVQIGGDNGGYFSVSSSSLSLKNVTVSDRYAKNKGGAIIANAGSNVNLENVNFRNCESPNGGAVYIANGGTASMKNVSISSAGTFASQGSSVYCENGGTLKLSGTISFASDNPTVGDLWIESQSKVEIGSTTNSFSVDCADLPDPHYGVLSVSEGGVSSGITSFNKSYELVEQDSYLHFAKATITEEVTFEGMNAIVNDEVDNTYFPLAFKLTLSAPASFQSSEYSYDVAYSYTKKNGQIATAHNGNVTFSDDEAYLVIGMNPALLTNDITWKVEKDGESVFSGSVKPLNCLKSYIENGGVSTQTIAKDLIVMGVYTEEYLYNTSTLRAAAISQDLISEGDLDLSGVSLPSTGYTKDWNSSEANLLTYYGCSLVLNEYGLSMRQYVYYGEGQGLTTMFDAIFCTVNGVDYPSILNFYKGTSKSTFYYAPVSNIKLSDLDKTNTFVFKYRIGQGTEFIDSGSIGYSVVDYMNMARNSKSTNTKLMNSLLSMYSLYSSCKAATQA